jgi:hypothetical protein
VKNGGSFAAFSICGPPLEDDPTTTPHTDTGLDALRWSESNQNPIFRTSLSLAQQHFPVGDLDLAG